MPKVQAMLASPSRDRLRNAIALKSAAILAQTCYRIKPDKDCISKDALWETRNLMSVNDIQEKILFMKVIENWNIPQAVPWLKEIINDKTNPVNLRIQATRTCMQLFSIYNNHEGDLKETMCQHSLENIFTEVKR